MQTTTSRKSVAGLRPVGLAQIALLEGSRPPKKRKTFKFGNDGTKASDERHRLPMFARGSQRCGGRDPRHSPRRDFLEASGGVIQIGSKRWNRQARTG